MSKIIVIVVTYNGMKWYKNCFDSIRNSSIHADTIVIDNNSSDGTVQFIKDNYPEIKLIESKVNLGFGKANNIGFRYAIEKDADFVFLLNQDAWVRPDTIEKLAIKLKENPEYGILSPIHLNGKENELDANFSTYIQPAACPNLISDFIIKGKTEDKIYPVKFVNAALWLISKKCIQTIGGFNPIFPHYGEDVDYIERLTVHKLKVGIYPPVFGIHDRIQFERRLTFNQKKNKYFVSHLIKLCDISIYFNKALYWTSYVIIMDILGTLLCFQIKDMYIRFYTLVKIILNIPQIIKGRNIVRKKGLNFL